MPSRRLLPPLLLQQETQLAFLPPGPQPWEALRWRSTLTFSPFGSPSFNSYGLLSGELLSSTGAAVLDPFENLLLPPLARGLLRSTWGEKTTG
mmetsp:Transcript_5819/g.17403  ORF Transcript_5819/g.17403 Transcript_5819/m.17403 type:complete len:93 (+) Transcript_5819:755-1033(+)